MAFRPARLLLVGALLVAGGGAGRLRATGLESVPQALQTFDTDVRQYNLLTLGGGATLSNFGDTQGALAIGGNLRISGGSVDAQGGGIVGDPTLYVTGSVTLTGTTMLNYGYAALPGLSASAWTWNSANHDLSANNGSGDLNVTNAGSNAHSSTSPLTNPAPAGFNLATVTSDLTTASNALAGAAVTGTISVNSQNLTFTPNTTPTHGGNVVFDLDASKISGNSYNGQTFSNVQIDVPTDVNYVINVVNAAGTTLFGSGVNVNSGTNDNLILWNIEGSGTVTLGGGSFYGSILAPTATIQNGGSTINGQVVANAFSDSGNELHFSSFSAMSVVVPEPFTFALWGVGLCALAVVARQKLIG